MSSFATVADLRSCYEKKELTAVDVVRSTYDFIARNDNQIGAFLSLSEEQAMRDALVADDRIASRSALRPLEGIPIAIKDNILAKGEQATAGSRILGGYHAPYDATVISRLRDAGAILIGRTNLDEFAMGSSTENSALGVTRNPWDLERVPGGSSGGSAAAVSAGFVPLALGSDTGGSIRQPASLCGIVGLKPTYGAVSRYGLIALGSSLDQIGPFARTVEDAAVLFDVIHGCDTRDGTSHTSPAVDHDRIRAAVSSRSLTGLRIGLVKEYQGDGINADVQKAFDDAVGVLMSLGATVKEISLPHTKYALPVYYIIQPAEASTNLSRFDGIRYGASAEHDVEDPPTTLTEVYSKTRGKLFGRETRRRIMLGTYALSAGYYDAYYGYAQKVRTLIKRDFEQVWPEIDVILSPTTPNPAFKFGEKTDDPVSMYLEDVYTVSANVAGIPGMSIPCGLAGGLPVGLQLLAPWDHEQKLFEVGAVYQSVTNWHQKHPSVA